MKQRLIYDLEVYRNFFLGVFKNVDTEVITIYNLGDDLLNDIIRNPEVTLIGFNNHHYDDVILNYISKHMQIITGDFGFSSSEPVTEESIWTLSKQIIENSNDNIIHRNIINNLKYMDKAYRSIDLKSLLDPMPSLKKLELRMNFKNVQDLPVHPDTMLSDELKEKLTTYCINDVEATEQLFHDHSQKHLKLREVLATKFNRPLDRVQSASEPKAAEYILSTTASTKAPWLIKEELPEINQVHVKNCIPPWIKFEKDGALAGLKKELKNMTLPINPDTGYVIGQALKNTITINDKDYQMGIGGLHSVDQSGTWTTNGTTFNRQLIEPDVTSYYPSMLIRDDLFPRGYDYNWSLTYQKMYEDRLIAKADPNKKLEADALKIILNATFGKFGSKYSSFYDPTLLVRITLGGQLGLLMLIEQLSKHNIPVLSANTDGVLAYPTKNQIPTFNQICKQWEHDTKLNLEYTHYHQIARRDVNNYTALTTDNKIKNKGIFTPPDIKHDVRAPIVQKAARLCLLYNETPESALNQATEDANIYDFLYNFSATRAFDIYLCNDYFDYIYSVKVSRKPEIKQPVTKTNRWYISKDSDMFLMKHGGVNQNWIQIPNAQHIKVMNQINDTQLPTDLDHDYYLNQINKLVTSCR